MSDAAHDAPTARRRKFLVVVDKSPECRKALRFASRRAEHTGGIVSLLTVVDARRLSALALGRRRDARRGDAGSREDALRRGARSEPASRAIFPEVIILEGKPRDVLMALLKEDPTSRILVLASGTGREGPGPLVSLVAQQAQQAYPIPVTIVPGAA